MAWSLFATLFVVGAFLTAIGLPQFMQSPQFLHLGAILLIVCLVLSLIQVLVMVLEKPVVFCFDYRLCHPLTRFLRAQLSPLVEKQLTQPLIRKLWIELSDPSRPTSPFIQFRPRLINWLWERHKEPWLITAFFRNSLTEENYDFCTWLDFCVSVLNCEIDQAKWSAFQSVKQECGWVIFADNACLVCDRPIRLLLDNQDRLHAEGEPALEYADGFRLYAHHGITLPETYGKLHPNQWRAEWLLSERNAELRRVLIEGVGYERIYQELGAIELDSWREYSLLKIDSNIDVEPIFLLKMTCPSTQFIHILRVPPNMNSAKEAIRWVNWDVNSEDFSTET
ncbi:DUF6745 domain-containing protein [Phormidesmis sp. 146-33]